MSATCSYCDQPMDPGTACTWIVEGLTRMPYNPEYGGPDKTCRDCGAPRGGLHHPGCDTEICPMCGGQAISCGCLWPGETAEEEES